MTDDTPNFLRQLRIPRPSSGHLAALGETDRPIAVFSDFDGTIFLQDTGHVLFDKFGLGKEEREEVDQSIGKTRTFREASEIMWGSLNVTLERAQEELRSTLKIDPDFIAFFDYLQSKNVEFTVISAGLKPLLRCALDCFVGLERRSTSLRTTGPFRPTAGGPRSGFTTRRLELTSRWRSGTGWPSAAPARAPCRSSCSSATA